MSTDVDVAIPAPPRAEVCARVVGKVDPAGSQDLVSFTARVCEDVTVDVHDVPGAGLHLRITDAELTSLVLHVEPADLRRLAFALLDATDRAAHFHAEINHVVDVALARCPGAALAIRARGKAARRRGTGLAKALRQIEAMGKRRGAREHQRHAGEEDGSHGR